MAGIWFAGPPVAGGLVGMGLAAAGFEGSGTRVDVEANPPLRLLEGHADAVRIRSRDVTVGALAALTIDVTLLEVGLLDRSAEAVDGRLDDVRVAAPDGDPVTLSSVEFDGPVAAASARVTVPAAVVEALAARMLERELGSVPGRIALASPDVISFSVAGIRAEARLAVGAFGDLVLAPASPALPTIRLLSAEAFRPLTLRSLAASPTEVVLAGTLDLETLLR